MRDQSLSMGTVILRAAVFALWPLPAVHAQTPVPPVQPVGLESVAIRSAAVLAKAGDVLAGVWPGYWEPNQAFGVFPVWGRTLVVLPQGVQHDDLSPLEYPGIPDALQGRGYLIPRLPDVGTPFDLSWQVAGRTLPVMATLPPFAEYRSPGARVAWLPDSVASMVMFIVHEAFHAFQMRTFRASPESRTPFADRVPLHAHRARIESDEFLAELARERDVLALALAARVPAERTEHLARYRSLRERRLQSLPPALRVYEDAQERAEGVATWVGYEAVRRAITHDTAEARRLHISELRSVWLDPAGLPVAGLDQYTDYHLYVVGAAKAWLLEANGVARWKERLADGDNLERLLFGA